MLNFAEKMIFFVCIFGIFSGIKISGSGVGMKKPMDVSQRVTYEYESKYNEYRSSTEREINCDVSRCFCPRSLAPMPTFSSFERASGRRRRRRAPVGVGRKKIILVARVKDG